MADTVTCLLCYKELPRNKRQTYLLAPSYSGAVLCRTCRDRRSTTCRKCGVRVVTSQESGTHYVRAGRLYNSSIYCIECSKTLQLCPTCGREFTTRVKLITLKDRNGRELKACSDCTTMDPGGDWGNSPLRLNYHGTIAEGSFYGLELETDDYESRGDTIYNLHKLHGSLEGPAFWLKGDGSLHHGIEICFHPRTVPSWTDFLIHGPFTEMKKIIEECAGRSYNTNTSGLHIHRESIGITDDTRAKLVLFFSHCKTQLQRVAQRRGNSYCTYNPFNPSYYQELKAAAKALKGRAFNDRYAITLFSHHDTVEFRLFRGTLAPKTLLAQISFTDALIDWLNRHEEKAIDELVRHKALWDKFMQDLQTFSSPATPYLHEFLTRKGFYSLTVRGTVVGGQ